MPGPEGPPGPGGPFQLRIECDDFVRILGDPPDDRLHIIAVRDGVCGWVLLDACDTACEGNIAPELLFAISDQVSQIGDNVSLDIGQSFRDTDVDYLAISVGTLPAGFSFSNGVLTGIALAEGTFAVTATATDPCGESVSQTFTWTVNPLDPCEGNNAPQLILPLLDRASQIGDVVSLDITTNFNDPDGDPLTFTSTALPAGLSISNGVISGTLTEASTLEIAIIAIDPCEASVSDTFSWVITPRDPCENNVAPQLTTDLPDQEHKIGDVVSLDITANFNDPTETR